MGMGWVAPPGSATVFLMFAFVVVLLTSERRNPWPHALNCSLDPCSLLEPETSNETCWGDGPSWNEPSCVMASRELQQMQLFSLVLWSYRKAQVNWGVISLPMFLLLHACSASRPGTSLALEIIDSQSFSFHWNIWHLARITQIQLASSLFSQIQQIPRDFFRVSHICEAENYTNQNRSQEVVNAVVNRCRLRTLTPLLFDSW